MKNLSDNDFTAIDCLILTQYAESKESFEVLLNILLRYSYNTFKRYLITGQFNVVYKSTTVYVILLIELQNVIMQQHVETLPILHP